MPYPRQSTIILDLNGSPIKTPVYLTPSDVDAYTLNFKIMNRATPFDITGATITAVFKVPNNETLYVGACTITDAENGLCSFDVPSDIYAVSGTVSAVLRIIKDTSQISTCGFLLQVNNDINESGGIEGSDHYPILLGLIADVQALDFSAKFHATTGHKHTGATGDAPTIGTDGMEDNAVTTDKIVNSAVTFEKLDTNLDNTSDLDKPISTATQLALDGAYEVDTLTITNGCGSLGYQFEIWLNDEPYIAMNGGEMTPAEIAGDIEAQSSEFVGWTVSAVGATITFTRNIIGVCVAPVFNVLDGGATGGIEVTTAGANGKADLIDGKVPASQLPASLPYRGVTLAKSGNSTITEGAIEGWTATLDTDSFYNPATNKITIPAGVSKVRFTVSYAQENEGVGIIFTVLKNDVVDYSSFVTYQSNPAFLEFTAVGVIALVAEGNTFEPYCIAIDGTPTWYDGAGNIFQMEVIE